MNAVAPARLTSANSPRGAATPKKKRALPQRRRRDRGLSFVHRAVSAREMTRWVRWVDDTAGEAKKTKKQKQKRTSRRRRTRVRKPPPPCWRTSIQSRRANHTVCVPSSQTPVWWTPRSTASGRARCVCSASSRRVGSACWCRRRRLRALPRVLLRVFSRGRRDRRSPTSRDAPTSSARQARVSRRRGSSRTRARAGRAARARRGGRGSSGARRKSGESRSNRIVFKYSRGSSIRRRRVHGSLATPLPT